MRASPWVRSAPVLTLAVLALAVFAVDAAARAKTDVVFLTNGDHVTGEVKQLSRGILQLSTDAVGTINIEWEDVDSLHSAYRFRVEETSGAKLFGTIVLTSTGTLQVIQAEGTREVSQLNVAAITPLEASFWQQIDGAISLGLSYTKSNSLGQLTTDFNARYRTPIRLIQLDFSSIATSQEDEATQRREDLEFSYSRLFDGPLFAIASTAAQSNEELGLDLRLMLTSGLGAKLVQTNHRELLSALGLSVNREWTHDSDDTSNLEAYLSVLFSVFRYDYPKTDVSIEGTVFPNLTDWGRVRSELDVSVSREIVKDFTLFLTFYDSFDSDPADPAAATNDYGLVTSFGWTF
jgi:Protein of unknown function, DUF481